MAKLTQGIVNTRSDESIGILRIVLTEVYDLITNRCNRYMAVFLDDTFICERQGKINIKRIFFMLTSKEFSKLSTQYGGNPKYVKLTDNIFYLFLGDTSHTQTRGLFLSRVDFYD